MKTELEIVLDKLQGELRNNKIRANDLLSQNTAYDVAIMFVEEAMERSKGGSK